MAHFMWNHPVQEEFNNLYLKIVQKKAKRKHLALKETVLNKVKLKTTDRLSQRSVLKDNTPKKIETPCELPRPALVRPPLLPVTNRSKLTATVSPTVNHRKNFTPSDDNLKSKKTFSAIETNESHLLCKYSPVSTGQQSNRDIPSPKSTQDIWRYPGALCAPVIQNDSSNHARSKKRNSSPETGYESDSSEKSGITYRTSRGKKDIKSTKQQELSLEQSSKSELNKTDCDDRERHQDLKCSQEIKHSCEQLKLGHSDHKDCCPEKDKGIRCNRASEKVNGLIFNKTLEKVKAIKEKAVMSKRAPSQEKLYNKPSKTDCTLIYNRSLRGEKVMVVKKIAQKNKAAIFKKLSGKDKSFICSKDSGQEKATPSRKRSAEENFVISWKDKAVIHNKSLKRDMIHRESSGGEEDVVFDNESGKDSCKKNCTTPHQQTTTSGRSSGLARNLDKSGIAVREDKVRPFKRKMDSQTKITNKRVRQKSLQSSLKIDEKSKMDLPHIIKDAGKRYSAKSDVPHSLNVNSCLEVDSFTALENLENKLAHEKPIEDMFIEPQQIGRQTCASRGLQYLSLASSHVGGIWRTIYSET